MGVFAFIVCIAVNGLSAGSSADAANLLFKTGFESTTTLGLIPTSATGTSAYIQPFSGQDYSTGFSWPIPAFGPTGINGLHVEGFGSDPLINHFNDYLDSSQSHSGTQSLYTDIQNYTNFVCCPQVPLQSSSFSKPIKQVYVRYWLMYPNALATLLNGLDSNHDYGRETSAFKTADDYRMSVDISRPHATTGTTLHGRIQSDALGMSQSVGNGCPYIDPITGRTDNDCNWMFLQVSNHEYTIPIGQWFQVEYFIRRNNGPGGKFTAAVNGHIIGDFDYWTSNYGIDAEEIHDFYWVSLYSSYFPMSQWLDDFEIWDAPPCGHLPCGTAQVGGTPPAIESYQGAVGSVGVPFSFQPVAKNNPTSWYYNNYGGTGLPPGLSFNTSTGLISGTPTAAGTYKIYVNATNAAGNAAQTFEIQINNSLQPPVIKTFSAYPTTVSAGNPSTLYYNVLCAGSCTLSIDQLGAVPGLSGTRTVTPSASTTYMLTVSNPAGSVQQSVTVNVGGTIQAPVITSPTSAGATVGSAFSYQIAATNNPTSYGASSLPAGLSVNTSTGVISGTPTNAGSSPVTISASNSSGSGSATLSLTTRTSAGGGAIAFKQDAAVLGSGVSSVSVGFPSANTAGNLIIALVRMSTTTQTVTVSDTLGNAYVDAVAQPQNADGHQIHIFYAKNIKAGSNTVQATFSAANNHPWLAIYEFSGLSTSAPLNLTHSAQGSSSTTDTGSVAGTGGAQLVFSAAGFPNSWTGTATSGAGYKAGVQSTNTARSDTEYQILSNFTGNYSATFALSSSTNWSCALASFH